MNILFLIVHRVVHIRIQMSILDIWYIKYTCTRTKDSGIIDTEYTLSLTRIHAPFFLSLLPSSAIILHSPPHPHSLFSLYLSLSGIVPLNFISSLEWDKFRGIYYGISIADKTSFMIVTRPNFLSCIYLPLVQSADRSCHLSVNFCYSGSFSLKHK